MENALVTGHENSQCKLLDEGLDVQHVCTCSEATVKGCIY